MSPEFPYPGCEELNSAECQARQCPHIVTDGAGVKWCDYVLWKKTERPPMFSPYKPNKSYVWLRPKKKKE